jgi:hypothetical protein
MAALGELFQGEAVWPETLSGMLWSLIHYLLQRGASLAPFSEMSQVPASVQVARSYPTQIRAPAL